MNLFTAQGRLLYVQEPKEKGRSSLFTMAIGPEKKETNQILQSTNKIILRIPGKRKYLTDVLNELPIDSYIEVFGYTNGLVRRNLSGSENIAIEFIVSGLEQAFPIPGNSPKKTNQGLFNRWVATGRIRAITASDNPKRPGTLYLQLDRDREDQGVPIQASGIVPVAVFGEQRIEHIKELGLNRPVEVSGHVTGLLTKTPRIDGQDGYESTLQAGLVLDFLRPIALIKKRLLIEDELEFFSKQGE